MTGMTPKEYEQAVLERFRIEWPSPYFKVCHNVRLPGAKSKTKRQIDVAIYKTGEAMPFLLIEAKRHGRRIDIGIAGSTIAMVQDIGGISTIMVATSGFSIAAANHLTSEAIGHLTITLTEAESLRWIPALEKRFAVDREFKEVSGDLVEALRNGDLDPFLDEIVPYEEWLAVIETGISIFPETTSKILQAIASDHFKDGYRYNAIQILSEIEMLDQSTLERLLVAESDPDTIELLEQCLADLGVRKD
jgi:hypothetical protein